MNLQDFDEKSTNRLKCLRNEEDGRCATYELIEEDHTLGNALRHMILKNPAVKFCGYALPHPNERKINLQIQVYDGQAIDALEKGLRDLKTVNDIVREAILKEKEKFNSVELESSDEDDDGLNNGSTCQSGEQQTSEQEVDMDEE